MTTVYKYPCYRGFCEQGVEMPAGAQILSAAYQSGQIVVYALVDSEAPVETRSVWVYPTGREVVLAESAKFIGTVRTDIGLMFHIFAA